MKLSIIIPFYHNVTIDCLLNSLLAQSYTEVEILCIGDNVEDPSHKIVKEYASRYPKKIFFYLQNNRGPGSARNFGLSLARGEYIMFADADDYVEHDIVKKLLNHIQKTDVDFVCCAYDRISKSGRIYSKEMMSNPQETIYSITLKNLNTLAFIFPAPWGKLFKRSLIGETRFPEHPKMIYEDLIFFLLLCPKIKRYSILPKILYHYVVSDSPNILVTLERSHIFRVELLAVKVHFQNLKLPKQYYMLLDTIAFIHVGVSDVYRITENPTVQLTRFIRESKAFLDTYFSNWRHISFIQAGKIRTRSIILYFLKVALLSNIYIYKLVIQGYIFMIKKFHIDIKW